MRMLTRQRRADELLHAWQQNRHLPPADRLKGAAVEYSAWIAEVEVKFEQPEEFALASEIYSFATAFEVGMTPTEAYADFDKWVSFSENVA